MWWHKKFPLFKDSKYANYYNWRDPLGKDDPANDAYLKIAGGCRRMVVTSTASMVAPTRYLADAPNRYVYDRSAWDHVNLIVKWEFFFYKKLGHCTKITE